MPVALAPTEPDACAAERTPEPLRRAAAVFAHGRPRDLHPLTLPRPAASVACERRSALQRSAT